MQELETTPTLKFRKRIPKEHQQSLDTRLIWLWNQRFGTVQSIYQSSKDVQDKLACTLILQAILGKDLASIELLLYRIEGGAEDDSIVAEKSEAALPL